MRIDPAYLLFAAFGVLGIIQWAKAMDAALKSKDLKKTLWTSANLFLSFLVAALGNGGLWQVLTNGVIILAFNEVIGYGFIVKAIQGIIGRISGIPAQASGFLNAIENAAGGGRTSPAPPGGEASAPSLHSTNNRGEP